MFEKEIKFIYDFTINEVRRLGAYFTYEELTSVDLHPAILKYISAELDYLIYEDRQRLLSNSNFDYSGGRIAGYFALIGEEIKKSKKFSFEYVDNLILHAISFNVNFLAQPAWALTKFIFEKEEVVKTAELKQIINYIYFYGYIKTIVEKYLQKKNLQILSRNEFESILDKVDQELLRTDASKLTGLVLNSIGEFFNIGSVIKSKIPLYPFKLYLKEKKLPAYAAKLESGFKGDARQSYDIIEVQNVLFRPEVKKAAEQKTDVEKPSEKKMPEQASDKKMPEQKPFEQKQFEPKKTLEKPEITAAPQNGENYLDRIVRQEKPASFFSFGRPGEAGAETERPEEKELEKKVPENPGTEVTKAEAAAPEAKDPEEETLPEIETPVPFTERFGTEGVKGEEEMPESEENSFLLPETEEDESVPEEVSFLMQDPVSGNEDVSESPNAPEPADNSVAEEESIVMEFSREEETMDELEFEPLEETDSLSADAKEDDFGGINIDDIDLDIIDTKEPESDEESTEENNSGFLSRLLKKGSRSGGNKKNGKFENDEPIKLNLDQDINLDEILSTGENPDAGVVIEPENEPEQEGFQGENTYSRIESVISKIYSKREQQKIISEIFSNRAEKFASAVYNVITEAHDTSEAESMIDSLLRANRAGLEDKWAKTFKKNIIKYLNQI